ncbi:ricin B lectin domain-containing protein [Ephemerocybe angulata]|uniref:Ricin B lectin domain-containing protein n=1 Tax=Ephemerocybe angulata TaxID=980116 RepID=A0A8H6MEV1_9AGAR|nr:ricin B lectin domain-containing protein [Tulosesus angulatus]
MLRTTSYLALIAAFFASEAIAQPPQNWRPVQLHPNWNSRKCLDVQGGVFANGTPVDIFDCNGTPAQNWIINPGNTRVQVAGQNFCLDAGEWPNDGTKMKIWSCYNNLPAQSWLLYR